MWLHSNIAQKHYYHVNWKVRWKQFFFIKSRNAMHVTALIGPLTNLISILPFMILVMKRSNSSHFLIRLPHDSTATVSLEGKELIHVPYHQCNDSRHDITVSHPVQWGTSFIDTMQGVQQEIVISVEWPVYVWQWWLPQATKEIILRGWDILASSSPCLSPVIFATKKVGGIQFYIDFCAFNVVIVLDAQPLPRIDELLESRSGWAWFTVLDSRTVYCSVKVASKDRPETACTEGTKMFPLSSND